MRTRARGEGEFLVQCSRPVFVFVALPQQQEGEEGNSWHSNGKIEGEGNAVVSNKRGKGGTVIPTG
jgi:hypothetical protein